jgi:DNA-binding transcriptional LysR family regulator
MFSLDRLPYFVAVAEMGSFAKASIRLGVVKSAVSTQITHLERELGVRLFNRTTRKVQLTHAGTQFLPECRSILEQCEALESGLHGKRDEISGPIRITATSDTGPIVLAPLLAEFGHLYPQVQTDLIVADEVLDLVSNGIDLAIREGDLESSSLKAIRLNDFDQWVVCGQRYSEAIRSKDSLEELKSLRWAIVSLVQSSQSWEFSTSTGQKRKLRIESRFQSNNTMAVLNWIESSPGCAILPDYLVREPVEAGRLVRLLPKMSLPPFKVHALHLPSGQLPKRVRILIDFLKAHLKN